MIADGAFLFVLSEIGGAAALALAGISFLLECLAISIVGSLEETLAERKCTLEGVAYCGNSGVVSFLIFSWLRRSWMFSRVSEVTSGPVPSRFLL